MLFLACQVDVQQRVQAFYGASQASRVLQARAFHGCCELPLAGSVVVKHYAAHISATFAASEHVNACLCDLVGA